MLCWCISQELWSWDMEPPAIKKTDRTQSETAQNIKVDESKESVRLHAPVRARSSPLARRKHRAQGGVTLK